MKTAVLLLALVGACLGSALPSALKPMPLLPAEPVPGAPVEKPQRIINPTPAYLGQFPNQVGLHFDNQWFCGGSLITPCTILTAAHCTDGMRSVNAYFGSVNIVSGTVRTSTEYRQHPDYDPQLLINDVAVIYLSSPVTNPPNIAVVAGLAPSNAGNYAGESAIASGWGITRDNGDLSNVLNWVTVTIITPSECAAVYGPSAGHASVICSRRPGNNGICSGDSGGPLILEKTGIQIGVVSFAAANACEAGYPSGYGRVSDARSWIDANTKYC